MSGDAGQVPRAATSMADTHWDQIALCRYVVPCAPNNLSRALDSMCLRSCVLGGGREPVIRRGGHGRAGLVASSPDERWIGVLHGEFIRFSRYAGRPLGAFVILADKGTHRTDTPGNQPNANGWKTLESFERQRSSERLRPDYHGSDGFRTMGS